MSPRPPDDGHLAALIAAVRHGDHAALAQLYDETHGIVHAVLLRMLHDPEQAQEALQDCYIRVWQRAETYDPERGEPVSWLIGNARYRALDLLRQARQLREREVPDDVLETVADGEPGPQQESEALEDLQQLMTCVRELPEMQRKAVLLAYYRGYSHQELSEALGAPLGTVKAWMRRGLARLRSCLAARHAHEQDR